MSLLERVYSFHQDILNNRYPNATNLTEQFEVSLATARRDIAYLRDRLLAPLEFDQLKNGFYYTEQGFSLPFTQSPKVFFLLGMIHKLAEEAGLKDLDEVRQLEEKLSTLLSADYQDLKEGLYCEWVEIESINTGIFGKIVDALLNHRAVSLHYTSASSDASVRVVEPQRLCNYQGRWYLLAQCRLRNDLRMFHLARIGEAEVTDEKISRLPNLNETYLQQSFGIFKGSKTYTAEILFTGTAAELVKHQHWHTGQEIEPCDEGIILRLPVSDDREIMMKILQYGGMARVLGPERLKERILQEISAMTSQYT
ncbi:YafY family protein [Desulfopila sp. IMCC35008]|uniref:helix-turn-helix transcriptional regulator n=1 Tax=Desulfopila sp. IMCC35008 TaxID=2653858 RepID=UPI0013D35853|nr:WYL domain-containing protein [Desulfopila sp. IMCC35008]